MKNTKIQFNTRVPKPLSKAVAVVSAATEITIEDITEAALAQFLGSSDKQRETMRLKAQMAAKQLNLSFSEAATRLAA